MTATNYSSLVRAAVRDAFLKLNPAGQVKNPVMFLVCSGRFGRL